MLGLIKKILLTGLVIGSNHTKFVSLGNQKYMSQPTLINLHPNEYSQDLTTTHLRLNYIDVLEIVILLMTYLIEHVFQK